MPATTVSDDELHEISERNPGWRVEWIDGQIVSGSLRTARSRGAALAF